MATPSTSDTLTTSSPPNLTPAPATKPANIGKAPEHTVANEQPPIAKEPVAQPPIHPFSGIPSHYAPSANRNFTAPDRTNDGAYRTMPPIYDIEQSKAVFKRVLSTKVTVSVGKLCSVSQDIRNQFRTAVTPKQLVGANTVQDPSNIFEDIFFTLAPPLPPTTASSCNVSRVKLECLISMGSPLLANSHCHSTKALAFLTDVAFVAILLANLLPVLLDNHPLCEQLFLVLSQQ
ncbi:hypothetical protein J132_05261 [Termitomyces sp. J132]|nr:hypothetical protein J132_05261 [Termitomyces sp. J132]